MRKWKRSRAAILKPTFTWVAMAYNLIYESGWISFTEDIHEVIQ
ncbi:hypothetical protein [Lentibacillus sp. JNUCC-1]|nr:hypothetical protein [Lentibacillus sp. JNUCC-1]